MRSGLRAISGAVLLALITSVGHAADVKQHRVAIQVNQNDTDLMNLALNNATNVMEFYKATNEDVQIEIVTYGPGLNMLREDTSPVKGRIKQLVDASFPSSVKFIACGNTKEGMEKREGKAISVMSEATVVPSGAVRLIELQEAGWSYLKP
ncbi:MAG: hypothetical protein EON84_14320 [Bradyrhizobiaceae bacterium]|jgi:intracellular sulfur oxidation DsrE/DsrF family protein|nr:MAG: hypothetical protein EON84_14320 [Bradyrhizobiaceae bacterium]